MLRVVVGKGDKPCETPIPPTLAESIRTVGDVRDAGVDEQVALLWGGWADLETFLDHYRGEASPKAQRREREKVGWS